MELEHQCQCAQTNEEELYPKLEEMIEQHRGKPAELIMALHKAQNLFGYLPKKAQEIISERLNVPISTICGVISFYSFFSTVPKGRHSIKVCLGTACYVRGSQQTLERVEKELNIQVGGTTEDRRFSLDVVRCIGACGLAPAMLVDNDVYGRVKSTKIMDILKKYE
ncbi:MAG TPA: NAD(P)H-dependent oxidoreductase subunit E [Syntrophorhabdaceae bacterium]|nr:NAD(P)H-dependent oxidoreductase subunit E [Syntrophorhabdaceae bacterium]HPP06689.1 NAD(P)H-dependent oxidoreductase subunit E [Syntrophorhabdaceae bacterium]